MKRTGLGRDIAEERVEDVSYVHEELEVLSGLPRSTHSGGFVFAAQEGVQG